MSDLHPYEFYSRSPKLQPVWTIEPSELDARYSVNWQPIRTRSVRYTCIVTRKNGNMSQTDPSDLDARYSLYWQPVRPTSL